MTIGNTSSYSYGDRESIPKSEATEKANVDWDELLGHFKDLKRLDLKMVPLESRHLPLIIEASGKNCWQLEALVLPRKAELEDTVGGAMIDKVMEALYAALESWCTKGDCGGLRQLTVPTRNEKNRWSSSTEFLEKVTRFCPKVEYLDGCKQVYDGYEQVRGEEQWPVSLDTWEKFVSTCTKLRTFDWPLVPFADPYFRAFAAYPKPHLKT